MSRSESAIFTNLCMVSDGNGNVLVQDRKNPDWPGVTFPGGHVEPEEAFTDSVIREVFEETGLTIEAPRLCGVKQFRTDDHERYVVFLYRADRFTGELRSSDEGETWSEEYVLSTAEDNDIGYPSTVELKDGSLLTVYYERFGKDKQTSVLGTKWKL